MAEEVKRKLGGVSDMHLEQTTREPTFYQKNDEHDNPCFYWKNPYSDHEEKVAMLFWPTHPYENTEEIEFLFEHLELRFLPPGLRSPVSHRPLPNEGDGREALVRPINEAPKHRDLFVYREDAGWMMAQHTCMTEFMTDAEIDSTEMSEFDLHEDDWFAYSQDGVYRLSNDGLPTLFVDPAALSQLTPAK